MSSIRIPRSARHIASPLITIGALLSCSAVLACHSISTTTPSGVLRRASATLVDAAGVTVGTVRLTEAVVDSGGPLGGVVMSGTLSGLTPGLHGLHVHAVGKCDATGAFATAGAHVNPDAHKHGLESTDGPHAGDLPNVIVAESGIAGVAARSVRVTLGEGATSLFDADGSALVLHASADDQRTDPSGGSGARIACGVVVRD
jgi:Cu-Zn family superoxide dismutase